MAFIPAFSFEEFAGTPADVLGTDLSTDVPVSVTSRRIYFEQADGTFLVPSGTTTDYIVWPLATNPITISDLLVQDTAVSARVDWLDINDAVVDTLTQAVLWQEFGYNFYYGLVLSQVPITIPSIQLSSNYWSNLSMLGDLLDSAANAITRNSDVYAASVCNDAVQNLISNQQYYF